MSKGSDVQAGYAGAVDASVVGEATEGYGIPGWLAALSLSAALSTLMLAVWEGVGTAMVAVAWGGALAIGGFSAVFLLARSDRRFSLHLFSAAFLARYTAAALFRVVLAWSGAQQLQGGSDYLHYDAVGWSQAEAWRAGDFSWIISYADAGYFYVVALVYAITGHYVIAPTLLNALFGAATAVITFKVGARLFGHRVGVIAGLLTAFLPTLLFWSSLLYKDVLIAFLVVAAVFLAIELREKLSILNAGRLALVLVPLFAMRTGMAAVFVLMFAAFLLSRFKGLVTHRLPAIIAAGALLLVLIGYLQQFRLGGGTVTQGMEMVIETVMNRGGGYSAEVADRVEEGFASRLYGRDLLHAPHLLILSIVLLYTVPIPGATPIGMNFATFLFPGQLIWLFLLPALVIGLVHILRERRAEPLFLVGMCAAATVAVVFSGFFSNPRYLIQVLPLLLIIMAVGAKRSMRFWRMYLSGCCVTVSFVMTYLLVR